MKKGTISMLAAAMVLMALAPSGTAARVPIKPGQTYLFCMSTKHVDAITSPLVKPQVCNTFGFPGRGGTGRFLWRLRWSSWGGPTARARGLGRFKVYQRLPVRVVLSRREDCRRRLSITNWVYKRLTVTVYDPDVGRYTLRMQTPGSCESLIQD